MDDTLNATPDSALQPGGRLYQSRQAILDAVAASRYLKLTRPMGAMYAFIGVRRDVLPEFNDQAFAMDLLENKHVVVAPGTSFNAPYDTHFRVTNLPEPEVLKDVFGRIEEQLDTYAAAKASGGPAIRVVGKA